MTQVLEIHTQDAEPEGLNWARITGITMALAVHVGALLLLLAPMAPPGAEKAEEEVTFVNIVRPPPPEEPPPVDTEATEIDTFVPPTPPSPPAPSETIAGSIDPSSQRMNPPDYPPAAARAGVTGTVVILVDIDAQGNVLNVRVEKSSRNRDLDRAAQDAPRKKRWRFNPAKQNGVPIPSTVRVPVVFNF